MGFTLRPYGRSWSEPSQPCSKLYSPSVAWLSARPNWDKPGRGQRGFLMTSKALPWHRMSLQTPLLWASIVSGTVHVILQCQVSCLTVTLEAPLLGLSTHSCKEGRLPSPGHPSCSPQHSRSACLGPRLDPLQGSGGAWLAFRAGRCLSDFFLLVPMGLYWQAPGRGERYPGLEQSHSRPRPGPSWGSKPGQRKSISGRGQLSESDVTGSRL